MTTKQNAVNNQVLSAIKKIYNDKIFKRASEIMNTSGEAATVLYIQTFSTKPVTVESILSSAHNCY